MSRYCRLGGPFAHGTMARCGRLEVRHGDDPHLVDRLCAEEPGFAFVRKPENARHCCGHSRLHDIQFAMSFETQWPSPIAVIIGQQRGSQDECAIDNRADAGPLVVLPEQSADKEESSGGEVIEKSMGLWADDPRNARNSLFNQTHDTLLVFVF